jgi:hypothetical protein
VAKAAVALDVAAAAPDAAVMEAVARAPDAAAVAPDVAVAEVVATPPDAAAAAPDVAEVVGPAQAAAFYPCRDHLEPPVRLQVIHPAARRELIQALPRTRSSRAKTVSLRSTSGLVLELDEGNQY